MNAYTLCAVILYFGVVGFIGLFAYLKNRKSSDFVLGARSLSYWVTALAAHASDMSGWLFMGFPAVVYTRGLIEAWTAIGLTLFMMLNWMFVAPALRNQSEKFKSKTLSSYLAVRFNDYYGILQSVSAAFCLMYFMFYISANLAALGHLFETIFNVSYNTGIIVGSVIVTYTLIGGFISIAWIDFFQGLFLMLAIITVPAWAYFHLPAGTNLMSLAAERGATFSLIPQSLTAAWQLIMLLLAWGLGYFGQPHIVTKFMGIDDAKNITKARLIGVGWQVISLTAAVFVAFIGFGFYPQGSINPEYIFINLTQTLFHPLIGGIILCAVLASAINVMGAQLLSSASVIAEDIVKKIAKQKGRENFYARLSALFLCLAALVIATLTQDKSIFDLVYYPWAGLGCSFGPILLLGLHTKLSSWRAATACVITGGLTAGLWDLTGFSLPPMIAGYALALIATGSVVVIEHYLARQPK